MGSMIPLADGSGFIDGTWLFVGLCAVTLLLLWCCWPPDK
jgi:hypothetical protein